MFLKRSFVVLFSLIAVSALASWILIKGTAVSAQSGGTFVIQKSVIAGGGGNSTGGTFIVDGTIGQPFAGSASSGGTFSVAGGFWSADAAASGSPTPTPGPAISGTITYGNAIPAATRFVSNVLVSGAGSPNVSTTTSFPGGTYSLSGFGAGAYTLTPTKTGGANNAITSFDAAKIAQHVSGLSFLTGNQLIVADVSGNGSITSFDAANIANFVVVASPAGSTGTWRFSPVNRGYASIASNIAGEDYSALLMGEVSGNWANTGARPNGSGSSSRNERNTVITAPRIVTPADREMNIPISVQEIEDKGIIAYEFEIRYDPTVIQPMGDPVALLGTVSQRLAAASYADKGLLRVAVYGPMPINSNGVLLNLRFAAVGAPGAVSPLTWTRILLNEGDTKTMVADGQVELSAAATGEAEITGRLLTAIGQGVPNARVTLTDTAGKNRSVISNEFGVYRFTDVQIGQSYTIRVESKRFRFTPMTVSVTDQLASVDLIAEP